MVVGGDGDTVVMETELVLGALDKASMLKMARQSPKSTPLRTP